MATLSLPERHQVTPYLFGVAMLPLCALFAFGEYTYDPNPLIVLVHAFDLIVHEAGHFIFRFFGQTMMVAGGSLLQILLPALFVYQGLYWSNRIGTQLALLLLGQNFVDVSIYAADAQARALPLLGGSVELTQADHRNIEFAGQGEAQQVGGEGLGEAFVFFHNRFLEADDVVELILPQ